jgi:hypothetical protein
MMKLARAVDARDLIELLAKAEFARAVDARDPSMGSCSWLVTIDFQRARQSR